MDFAIQPHLASKVLGQVYWFHNYIVNFALSVKILTLASRALILKAVPVARWVSLSVFLADS